MKKKRKQKPWAEETAKLETFMYENGLEEKTMQFSSYHFRIKTNKATVDIWAGSKKFYIKGTGGSSYYDDVNELKQYLL